MDIYEMGVPQNSATGTRFHVCRYLDGKPRGFINEARWRTLTDNKGVYQSFGTLEEARDWARMLHERSVVVHAIVKVEYHGRSFIAIKDITNPKPVEPAGNYADCGSW